MKALAFVALLLGSATARAQTIEPFPLEREFVAADTDAKLSILSNLSKSDLPAGFWVAERGFWDTSPRVRDAAILTWLKLADTLPTQRPHGYDLGPLPGLESFRLLGVKALPALKLGLEERYAQPTAAVARAIAMIDHDSAIPLLFHIVKTAHEPRDYYAARALTRWRSSEVLNFLVENVALRGPNVGGGTAAGQALAEHRVDIVNWLIQVAADVPVPGDDIGRLSYLSLAVADHKDPKARTYLSRAFASSDPRLRKGALRLSVVADKGRILQALDDPDPAIRAEARTLMRYYLPPY